MDDQPYQRQAVSDLSRYDRPDGCRLAARDARRARFLGEIVAAGSMLDVGDFQLSSLACRRRPARRPCGGQIRLGREPVTDAIRWQCTSCGDGGLITNWRRTRWDLSEALARGHVVSLSAERARRRAPIADAARGFELEVELVSAPMQLRERTLRRIRVPASATLEELHQAIAGAFERAPAREPYEFMFGAPYDPAMRTYTGVADADALAAALEEPAEPWETQLLRLAELGLREGDSFGYLYDFANEWVHRVTVVGQGAIAVEPRSPAPRPPPPEAGHHRGLEAASNGAELEPAKQLSEIYGPYRAEVGPIGEDWLALDDLERQLLALEAHLRELPANHPPTPSLLLHALVHSLAETELAEHGVCCPEGERDRHAFVHRLGEELVRALLAPATAREEPCLRDLELHEP
jgi:hypothetical protein